MMKKYCPLFLSSEKVQVDYCLEESCAWWNVETEKCGIIKAAEKDPLQVLNQYIKYPKTNTLENKPPLVYCTSTNKETM